ncbi:MAG: hypothetical protein JNM17_03180 [Archangium sp.]|nr:hypothetical protein [Archangium sp.]
MTSFFILQRGEGHPMSGHSTAGIDASGAEPGPPLRIQADVPSDYADKHQPLGDVYSHMDFIGSGWDETPLVIASAALFEKLRSLAGAEAFTTWAVEIVDTHGAAQPFVAVRAVHVIEPRDAQPGDLQWATTAFDPTGAPVVFGVGEYLVVSAEIGKALGVEKFAEVALSPISPA